MRLTFGLVAIAAAGCVVAFSGGASPASEQQTSAGTVMVEPVVTGLDTPWAMTFLTGGAMLITERDGRIWHAEADGTKRPVAGVPEVVARNQGGLLDVVAARDFAESREVFLTYSEPATGGARTALAIATLSEDASRIASLNVIFRQTAPSRGTRHFGSRVVEATDGTLWLTIGDRGEDELAQDLSVHNGKVVRLNRDGSFPSDNPDWGTGAAPGIWSAGHRNPQGAAMDAQGRLWTVSHGARGGDEINRPEPGKNYGWPTISYGTQYSGGKIGTGTAAAGLEQPLFYWDPSIAPSGMMIYSGKLWPEWQGDIFVGALKHHHISRLDREGETIASEEKLFEEEYIRIRDIREGPDGAIWFLAVGDGALYRITPAD